MKKIVLASNNAGKLREFSRLFADLDIEIIPQGQLGVSEAEEPHATFVENALAKARHAARITGLPALADDSGICVHALGGAPGVYSARYAGEPKSDARNNEKLIADLAGQADRRAFYYAALVLVRHADDPQPVIADGFCDGLIVDAPQGDGGFGYDPHFFLPQFGKTVAEITPEEKSLISHRGKALRELIGKLKEHGL
ncbi:XTP/dITP diphosphohydrolase [Formivibrio citricus]|uniref:dITP/XTP pyrophosphatase n=1 Tax=Formivibrio citricus TaxID=83765 RepID=A0A1I4X011_9NEIS|nr:RdgB/HAM1 family non-canonical purine NTP pyrophosphatase [Formivibrio citricus]SFN19458.1 XTP/dITP diphosphohydrolase [Formivibrio citricus]